MLLCSGDGLGAHGARTKSPRRCCISSTCAHGVSHSYPHAYTGAPRYSIRPLLI